MSRFSCPKVISSTNMLGIVPSAGDMKRQKRADLNHLDSGQADSKGKMFERFFQRDLLGAMGRDTCRTLPLACSQMVIK